ncbi:MAG TPA: 4-hydroxy-tetrahydrodipicolinate synthase [Actinomycetota bacterium]|nr:4-hydroxy-tetrahydrodipicolinate synthase [Actinomycetota bacterium]
MAGRFGAVLTAMVTPFREDRSLDLDRAQQVARWLLDHGSDGLVVAGTTGESPTLSDREKTDLWRAVVEAVEGRGPVIAGTGTYDTAHSVHLSQEAEKAGCDAALVVSPYYNKPPQEGLYEHFTTVARQTALPVILYNIPGRTAVRIDHATLLRLAEVENIVAVKDATGDLAGAAQLIAEAPSDFEVISGEDALTFALACLGGTGVISVTSHVVGERMGRMLELVASGDVAAARTVDQELGPVYRALFMTTSPIPVKAAMGLLGQPVGPPRLPLVPATDEQVERLRRALEDAAAL